MNTWNLNDIEVRPHNPVVLQSDEGAARIVAISLPAGEELGEHEVHEHAWLFVHSGTVDVSAAGRKAQLTAGGLAHWRPQERHTVRAVEDSMLVLALAPWPGPGHPNLRHQPDAAAIGG